MHVCFVHKCEPEIVCCIGGHSWVYCSISNRKEGAEQVGRINASMGLDTPVQWAALHFLVLASVPLLLVGMACWEPKLVTGCFANNFLFTGTTKQPSDIRERQGHWCKTNSVPCCRQILYTGHWDLQRRTSCNPQANKSKNHLSYHPV